MLDTDIQEAWRCDYCNKLIHNIEWANGYSYPAVGAPPPRYLNKIYQRTCTLCFDLHHLLVDRPYFMRLHTQWEEAKRPSTNTGGWM